jgi:hypothetical protein
MFCTARLPQNYRFVLPILTYGTALSGETSRNEPSSHEKAIKGFALKR